VTRVVVIHYDAAEAAALASRLSRDGFEAEGQSPRSGGLREFRDNPPEAIVIDLMRMPSYGRWVGVTLREQKGTRSIPLVFLEGDPAKTRLVRKVFPDAVFAGLANLGDALRKAIAHPVRQPVAPNVLNVPATQKLGIGKCSIVGVVNAPAGFNLGKLPEGAKIRPGEAGADTILIFVKSAAALGRELPALANHIEPGRKWWILWPKRASGVACDLTMARVFEMCTPYDLAAHKICAVDETWSALAVARRRTTRRGSR